MIDFANLKRDAKAEYQKDPAAYNALGIYILSVIGFTTGLIAFGNHRQQKNIEKAVSRALENAQLNIVITSGM